MKKFTRILSVLFFLVLIIQSCTQDEEPLVSNLEQEKEQENLIPQSQIDQLILKSLQETGDFIWAEQSDLLIWSALMHSDSTLTIGYKPASETQANSRIGLEKVSDPNWEAAAQKIIKQVDETLTVNRSPKFRINNLQAVIHSDLPYLEVKLIDLEVISNLRKMGEVRYLEPKSYEFNYTLLNSNNPENRYMSDSGCGNDPQNLSSNDFTVITPSAKSSWNYEAMGISAAWAQSTGEGITVGVIDTGISPDQPMFNSLFNSGQSSGRYIQRFGTHQTGYWWWKRYDGPDDQCGHGTAMAGVIASPRNTVGNAVGVAYNANLVTVRGTSDVIINSGNEKDGVAEALVLLGNRSDVKIISMSIGDVFYNSKVADAVRYAFNRGKLIFAAAGTSTSFTNWYGVIFPATMSETIAVTGVKEGTGYQRCDTCHSGAQVEFTVVMERSGTNTKPLTTANYSNNPATVGGSSVATATTSGIAALIWSQNPNWNRNQVLQRMRESSDLFPNRNSQYGFGNINAAAALGVY
ncbi:Subtilase family protein [Algoriphagus ornithinivorans]|uniref:Subtilase family protein n=1 Tax=Algoriphagus ornithinivorans TaxID=226506 RepID=A0A1I5GTV3_9BACT|nr:S8/S53 family peptidase [Algoriphagus ornithinivorans]SFO39011.1 Subtilase family protein [Algoriphagus ornithinivorans]